MPNRDVKRVEAGVCDESSFDATPPALGNATTTITGTIDPIYEAKARVLNAAVQEIGMGWYQWQLFVVVGFGWASDNMWPIVTSLICDSRPQSILRFD